MSTDDTAAGIRWRTHVHLHEVAAQLAEHDVSVERPSILGPGHSADVDVEPLTGIRAALFVRKVAIERLRHYASEARGDGVGWHDVGGALDLADDAEREGLPLGEAAWFYIVEGVRPGAERPRHWGHAPTARWTCRTCSNRITDHGPFDQHPDDTEEGHATDCIRHNADLAEFHRRYDEQEW